MEKLILKPKREESLLRKHPWIFSGSIANVIGAPELGATVDVYSSGGTFLAKAAFSPHSNIRARVWTWNQDEVIDSSFFMKRIMASISTRENFGSLLKYTNALRLVHGESDGLPGLIVDRYSDVIVFQLLTAGVEYWRNEIISILSCIQGVKAIYERSDSDVRNLEGLDPYVGLQWGELHGENVKINEGNLLFEVNISSGQKTGFYLDQRDNRRLVRALAKNCTVLDCFSYTGGFTMNALVGGATSVTAIDSSEVSLVLLKKNVTQNHLPWDSIDLIHGDVFQVLRMLRDRGKHYDLIILDPPKFAHTQLMAHRAARGYKDINLLAFKLLRPGGILMTFSCSGGISAELFQKIVAGAALDAGVDGKILRYMRQDVDHPVALNFPEGAYLKGLVVAI